ncbi:MAG: hypothetical protein GYB41_13525 [Oceanospirillales bacterium]|nr:hypothetical protein [Oceanospirillales bacterium]
MANNYPEVTVVEPKHGIDQDLRSLKIDMDDPEFGVDPLDYLREQLGTDLYNKFLWS